MENDKLYCNYKILFLLVFLFVITLKQNIALPIEEESNETKYPPEQLIEDLDYLFTTLESIHPDLYFYTPKDTIDLYRNAVIAKLDKPKTLLEFWKLITPVVVKLKDGHTGLYFPYIVRNNYLDNEAALFPFDITADSNRLFIKKNYTSDSLIGINSEILSINNIPVRRILQKMRIYHNGERLSFIDLKVSAYFKYYLRALYNIEEPYQIDFISVEDGKSFIKSYKGITLTGFKTLSGTENSSVQPYSFYKIDDRKVGVIDFRSMKNLNNFKTFLDSTFRIILNDSIEDLIIDIRKNGGGNSMLADYLLSHFNEKPYTQATQMDIKVSKQSRKQFRKMIFKWYTYPLYPIAYFNSHTRPILFGKKGKIATYKSEPEQHIIDDLFYNGRVYLLTGPMTFSSANILTTIIKCYNMGTIIGEETGGLTIAFGDIIYYELPNTKLRGGCSFKKFYHPCGKEDNHGVIPDIEIKQNPADVRKGIDSVLEFTLDYIDQN